MAKVKLDLRNKSVADKLTAAQTVMTASTGNPVVPAPQPKLTALSTAHYNLDIAANAAAVADNEAKEAHEGQDAAEAALDKAYGDFGDVVQEKSGGDAVKITSTGYGVASDSHAPIVLTAPAEFTASAGDEAGEIDVHWDRVRGARSYETQATSDASGATGWGNSTPSTKSKASVLGLASGTNYALRARAIGASGAGPWSQVVIKRAP